MATSIVVSAPGKLMLLGGHAVVYGRPCIVTAVGQRLEAKDVKVVGYKKSFAILGTPLRQGYEGQAGDVPKGAAFVERAVSNFLMMHPMKQGIKVTTSSEFASAMGFGSSSASTVCVLKALSELTGAGLSNRDIFDLSYKTVIDVQKKGSGFDVAAAVYGGTLWFVKGGEAIEPLSIASLPMVIGYTGMKADTVELMNQVSMRAKKYPAIIDELYTQIGMLMPVAKDALLAGDWVTFGECIDFNQGYLESLGVSTLKLSSMIHAAREVGALGAKLSGAGGGDCMIAIVDEDKRKAVSEAIERVGGEVIDIPANVEGVRVEVLNG